MSTENSTESLLSSSILRMALYAVIGTAAIRFLDGSTKIAYYFITMVVVFITAYLVVSERRNVSLFVIGTNILFVHLSTYQYLSSSEIWFSFYGVEILVSLLVGMLGLFFFNLIGVMIVGSTMYGDLKKYSEELEKRRLERHEDPFGDDHAQRILNESEDS